MLLISLNEQIMTLHQLIHKVNFEDIFSDLLRHVPEVENMRPRFMSAFDTLRSITPAKKSYVVVEVLEKDYLCDGVHDTWINATNTCSSTIWESILAGKIRLESAFNMPDTTREITNEMIVADLLWQLVSYGFPEESTALPGYILHNKRFPDSSRLERIEEICSYIDLHQVTEISHKDICQYGESDNIVWITDITPYSLPHDKAAYDMICFLDDFMWFNNETKTILIISASAGHEKEERKIEEFANSMLKNPKIVHGIPMLPGIEVMAIFITEQQYGRA